MPEEKKLKQFEGSIPAVIYRAFFPAKILIKRGITEKLQFAANFHLFFLKPF